MSKSRKQRNDERKRKLRKKIKRRTVKHIGEDGKVTIIEGDSHGRGYNVEMIRDFLDHLLLEVRVCHFENSANLKRLLEPGDTIDETNVFDSLAEQFLPYHERYATALLESTLIDESNATKEEIREVSTAMMTVLTKKRDDQLGHLEALQELFDEALRSAKMPFGITDDGTPVMPMRSYKVREIVDNSSETPDYDELLPRFDGHLFASDEGIEALKEATVIVAENDAFEHDVIIFGRVEIERIAKGGEGPELTALRLPVDDADELQFLVATVQKIKGRHDYDGNYYDEF